MDVFTKEKRSWIMSRVTGRDTKPEITIRKIAHALGFRFRTTYASLPGKPDIVFPRLKKVIFAHGCFWHGHKNCNRGKPPTTNISFWTEKIRKNVLRDRLVVRELKGLGWSTLIIWQCQMKNSSQLERRLRRFLEAPVDAKRTKTAKRRSQKQTEKIL
jgi:DNA mismatch endonuclease (patch repair protein)